MKATIKNIDPRDVDPFFDEFPELLDGGIIRIKDRILYMFEARINELIQTDISKLPQWTDADIIAAHVLITQYRKQKKDILIQ